MTRLTANGIEKYLTEQYGECKHDASAMKTACATLAKELKISAVSLFHYIVERTDNTGLHLTSYGFDTASGREVRETFEAYYYDAA
jgi:hypothetical protein